jgi:DNA-binding HxlR family transcriptional regulator
MNDICPKFEKAVQLLGKRWMGLIVYHLLSGDKRFSDLEKDIPISAKILSERLKELEKEKILIRTVYPETPVRIEYTLTKKGISLKPVMQSIEVWSNQWVK